MNTISTWLKTLVLPKAPRRMPALAADRRGVTAVEFALVAPVLILMVFEIIEVGRVLHTRGELAYALDRAARLVYLDPAVSNTALSAAAEQYLTTTGNGVAVDVTTTTENGVSYRVVTLSQPYTLSGPLGYSHQITLSVSKRTPAIVGT